MLSLDELNPYSRRFAERLFTAYPRWRERAIVDPNGGSPPGSLRVRVPSPVSTRELGVRTYGEQITVDFGPHGWHDHFGEWSGKDEGAIFAAALAFIADLLAERVVLATRCLFGRPVWSRPMRADRLRKPLFGRLEVYSWSGGRDDVLGAR